MEGTENIEDETFLRRHQKFELDEKRRKRWDIQRMREQRHCEKLRARLVSGFHLFQRRERANGRDGCVIGPSLELFFVVKHKYYVVLEQPTLVWTNSAQMMEPHLPLAVALPVSIFEPLSVSDQFVFSVFS